jgi:7,8-dihydro-6-hydroxymethylpterin-pyrophosphokinase
MKSQHQVILSIGSNQGNRLENVRHRIDPSKVGTVIKVSKVYETPSWGFDSDAFYNCALIVHTFSSTQDSYRGLKDRKELGVFVAKGKLSISNYRY